jgi:hypothetical protein
MLEFYLGILQIIWNVPSLFISYLLYTKSHIHIFNRIIMLTHIIWIIKSYIHETITLFFGHFRTIKRDALAFARFTMQVVSNIRIFLKVWNVTKFLTN